MKCWRCQKVGHKETKCGESKSSLNRGQKDQKGESNNLLEEREGEDNQEYLEAIIDTGCRACLCDKL